MDNQPRNVPKATVRILEPGVDSTSLLRTISTRIFITYCMGQAIPNEEKKLFIGRS